jgi:hypothetical protein
VTKVDCSLLEYLCGDRMPPRKSSHLLGDGGVTGDDEYPAGFFALLPGVEGIDEVVSGPGHLHQGVKPLRGKCVSYEPQALVVGEPGCTGVPSKHRLLGRRGIQGESEGGVPHLVWNLPADRDIDQELSPVQQGGSP